MAGVVLDTSVWIQMERTESLHPLLSPDDELLMTAPALAGISGVGSKKLEAYGEEVLRVVASAG